MKYLQILLFISVLTNFSCNQSGETNTKAVNQPDKETIEKLIKKVLSWSETKATIDLLPAITDNKDTLIIGFDMIKLKSNLDKLKNTGLFSKEFIDNYSNIIVTLDKKMRNGEYDKWYVGELPTFIFANDYDPWWNGQERFSIQNGSIEQIKLDQNSGEFNFICGEKGSGCEGMDNYKMRFRVIREDDKWKISYMEGFDFKESTRKDGEL